MTSRFDSCLDLATKRALSYWAKNPRWWILPDEAVQAGRIGLMKALDLNPQCGPGLISYYVRREVLMAVRERFGIRSKHGVWDFERIAENERHLVESRGEGDDSKRRLVAALLRDLTHREALMVVERYWKKRPHSWIAEKFGYSSERSSAAKLHSIRRKMRRLLERRQCVAGV